ncbi:MAG: thermonuclease family protein [Clostridia bacterium]
MYYENKSTFYVKQYGSIAIVSIVSVILITIGGYIFFRSSGYDLVKEKLSKFTKTEETTKNNEKVENKKENKKEEKNNEKVENKKEEKVENKKETKIQDTIVLNKIDCKVSSVSDAGIITAKIDGNNTEFALIGINNITNEGVNKIKEDIKDKTIKIAYDKQKQENNITYVYLYIDNKLYNAELLKTGSATLRVERNNTELLGELLDAQNYARENSIGVFK